jgi:hypothetical protein
LTEQELSFTFVPEIYPINLAKFFADRSVPPFPKTLYKVGRGRRKAYRVGIQFLVTSPWGVGILKLSGNTLTVPMMAPNGTRFGGWLLETADNNLGPSADYDGDGHAEILITSPGGIGILKLVNGTLTAPMMAANGTRFGGWLLNTVDNRLGSVGKYGGGAMVDLFITSPWGVGILKLNANTLAAPMMQPNGTRFGGWLLETSNNHF